MNFLEIEKKWSKIWSNYNFEKFSDRKKKYLLSMLPYPSGNLHMGHVKNYLITDVLSRYYHANGYYVVHPMGWDAFGLPAENAARDNNISPSDWTYSNIDRMRGQLKNLCFFFDWKREFATCDDTYYKHEQEIFIKFYNSGLAFQKEGEVNWDPVDKTVLANEQVIDGRGWRSNAVIEKRMMKQWYLKISDYAQKLLDGIEILKDWPESVKSMQKEWIGKSEGNIIKFDLSFSNGEKIGEMNAFSTRIETLFGAKFVAISTKNKYISKISDKVILDQISDLIEKSKIDTYSEEKIGVNTGLFCKNPLFKLTLKDVLKKIDLFSEESKKILKNIDENEFKSLIKENCEEYIPVYVANFVLEEYGTGVVFGCPAHDERDFEFAKKYNISIKKVFKNNEESEKKSEFVELKESSVCIDSFFLNGFNIKVAKEILSDLLCNIGISEKKVNFKLKDWCISRQRFWGCPIPMIYCPKCGLIPESITNLPVRTFDERKESLDDWKKCKCHKCGTDSIREADTLDTFFESSWYFLRYLSAPNDKPFDSDLINQLMPVDCYVGGIEHATMHLIYARFFVMALKDSGYNLNFSEPFTKLVTQGMIRHETYRKIGSQNDWIYPDEIYKEGNKAFLLSTKEEVEVGQCIKMSKSKKNTIDPVEMLEIYGADAIRFFILSDYPVESSFDWSNTGLDASYKYINKLYQKLSELRLEDGIIPSEKDLDENSGKFIKQLNDAVRFIEKIEFNKLIASIRIMYSLISSFDLKNSKFFSYSIKEFLKILYCVCPNLGSELNALIFNSKLQICEEKVNILEFNNESDTVKLSVQINGKFRGIVDIKKGSSVDECITFSKTNPLINKYIDGNEIKKTIFIQDKVLNFILEWF